MDNILYDSIYVKSLEVQTNIARGLPMFAWGQSCKQEIQEGGIQRGKREFWRYDYHLDCGCGYIYVKMYQIVQFRLM